MLTCEQARSLADRFDKEHIALRLKPSTAKGYRRMLERFVIPVLGNHRVNEVTRADIASSITISGTSPTMPTAAWR